MIQTFLWYLWLFRWTGRHLFRNACRGQSEIPMIFYRHSIQCWSNRYFTVLIDYHVPLKSFRKHFVVIYRRCFGDKVRVRKHWMVWLGPRSLNMRWGRVRIVYLIFLFFLYFCYYIKSLSIFVFKFIFQLACFSMGSIMAKCIIYSYLSCSHYLKMGNNSHDYEDDKFVNGDAFIKKLNINGEIVLFEVTCLIFDPCFVWG